MHFIKFDFFGYPFLFLLFVLRQSRGTQSTTSLCVSIFTAFFSLLIEFPYLKEVDCCSLGISSWWHSLTLETVIFEHRWLSINFLLFSFLKQIQRGIHGLEPITVSSFPTKKFGDMPLPCGQETQWAFIFVMFIFNAWLTVSIICIKDFLAFVVVPKPFGF